jgi:histidine ammonia-lyase
MVTLNGTCLTIEEVAAVACTNERVELSPRALRAMADSRRAVESAIHGAQPVYALNTGVGLLANIRLDDHELEQMQLNLVRSHCCGVGAPLPREVVRGMMLIRANVLAHGFSGIRPLVAQQIVDFLNHGITPVVPSRGSVGASGDLAPLSHMALALIGEGSVEHEGNVLPTADCLAKTGLQPITLQAKEGISLLNGTQAMLSIGCLELLRLEALFFSAQVTAAFSLEALRGTPAAFDPRLHAARPHPGQVLSATHLLALLEGSPIARSHGTGNVRIQDAYCLRCIPQVHGAAWDAFQQARRTFEIELNSVTDNPLVFLNAANRNAANRNAAFHSSDIVSSDIVSSDIVSGGNFHGAPLALALDSLAIALYQLAGISERRTERLLNPSLNEGLPAFLADRPGIESGLMMAQVTAAALVAEIRVLATPASIGSIPTSGNQEDFVSMGMTSALKLQQSVRLAEMTLAIETLAATRALDMRHDNSTAPLEAAKQAFRHAVPAWKADQVLSPLMQSAAQFIAGDGFQMARNPSLVDANG